MQLDHVFEDSSFGVKHLRPICTLGIYIPGTLSPSTMEHDPIDAQQELCS